MYGDTEIEIVDDGGIDLFMQKPIPCRLGPQLNGIFMLHAPLPAAEGC
jgi:hypothetical protein